MSFHDKSKGYAKTMPTFLRLEKIKIILRDRNSGDTIKHGDEVALQSNSYTNRYVKCVCDDWCIPGEKDWFKILDYSRSSGPITYSSTVHFEKSCEKNFKISARKKPWLLLDTGYGGSCESWEIVK